ncbi:putative clathrin assembly protein At2g25430 [Dendrobium catenatum]|uniref:Clathrin assembly protein n=1 Tax=Dendrobium catenatum TaxID=906689 RepID=A0A2I0X6G1_9ASPA|nr:putative clathrin assembly protein At2g25430 [Dendrobium catenatum]PKU83497.1 Putative clathrin assembly protein [Dendrobium catenatum]
MSSSTIRKAIGAVKDHTSIGLAKVSSNVAPDLEVAILKATSHDDEPADEKHIREILNLSSYSRGYASACVSTVSRRLGKTRDWIVALKTLMLIHRLLNEDVPSFHHELLYATRRGTRLLNMSDFRDEVHSSSWDHSAFVRTYALFLDQRLEYIVGDNKQAGYGGDGGGGSFHSPPEQQRSQPSYIGGNHGRYSNLNFAPTQSDERRSTTPLREMAPEKVLGRMNQLQKLFDQFLACRPIGLAKNNRMIIVALYPIVRESFKLYADIHETFAALLDLFFDMEYAFCVKSFDAFANAAKQIDELNAFYGWCKDAGVARSSEYPEVQRITDKFLKTLEEFMRSMATRPNTSLSCVEPDPAVQEEEPALDMNNIKALPAPSEYEEQPVPPVPKSQIQSQPPGDLVDLREEDETADAQGNMLALALFSGGASGPGNRIREAFPSVETSGEGELTSSWQTPAAKEGKADWELALAETASNLAKNNTTIGGGFDHLLLNGLYDHGAVRRHESEHTSFGSVSSVALPGPEKTASAVLSLPAPDGTVQNIGGDPFAASLSIPPPSYVQMCDIEKKQQLLMQEQQWWRQYTQGGIPDQASLAKLNNAHYYYNPGIQYGMPNPAAYYYPNM